MPYIPEPVAPDELPHLAVDVRYEFDMLRFSTLGLLEIFSTHLDRGAMRNLLVESLNLHARNLVGFFGGTLPVRGDDVIAQHFVPAWDPSVDGGAGLAYLETELVQSIHKRLAHITAYRVRVAKDDDALPVFEICWTIIGLFERFLMKLSVAERAWFEIGGQSPDLSPPIPSTH